MPTGIIDGVGLGTQDIWVFNAVYLIDNFFGAVDILPILIHEANNSLEDGRSLNPGWTFWESSSFEGRVTSKDRDVLPSIRVNTGLIKSNNNNETFFVVFSSPYLEEENINIDVNDFVELDVTSSRYLNLNHGINLELGYWFGQLVQPPVPSLENGLSHLDAFVERWKTAGPSFLGTTEEGAVLFQGMEGRIVEGSQWLSFLGKGFSSFGASLTGALQGAGAFAAVGLALGTFSPLTPAGGALIGGVFGATLGGLGGACKEFGDALQNNNPTVPG